MIIEHTKQQNKGMYQAYLFDLDGTVLHTISDITIALNKALKETGFDFSYKDDETVRLIGMGARNIIVRALKDKPHTKKQFDMLYAAFQRNYSAYQGFLAEPYEGIVQLLDGLKKEGKLLFIVSNKPHKLAEIMIDKYFPNTFDLVYGHIEHLPEKPNPHLVEHLLKEYKLKREDVLFIGDSDVDYLTAKNADVPFCLVTWGYGDYTLDFVKKSQFVAKTMEDLTKVIYRK